MSQPEEQKPADDGQEASPPDAGGEPKPKSAAKAKAKAEREQAKAEAHAAKQAKKQARAAKEQTANGAAAVEGSANGAGKPEKAKAGKKAAGESAKAGKAGKASKKQPFGKRARRRWMTTKKRARGKAKAARRRWKLTRRATRRVYNRRYRFTYASKITRVPARDELPALLNRRGLLGRGVEIGVKLGHYSEELLSNWKGEELISIDPWMEAEWEEYVDRSNVSQDLQNDNYEKTKERLAPYGSRSTIWRLTSTDAAPKVEDHSLDFVYVDARHDYDSVLEDLEAWCTKVKPGGILAGHDYVNGDLPQGEFYVKKAVDEFFGNRDIPVHGTEGPTVVEMFPTWIVEVPEDGIVPTAQLRSGRGTAAGETADEPTRV